VTIDGGPDPTPADPTPADPYLGYAPPPPSSGPSFRSPTGRPTSLRRVVFVVVVVAAVVGGGIGAGTVALFQRSSTRVVESGLATTNQAAPAATLDGSITAAAARIGPSVVTINVTSQQEQDTGSGVVIRGDGYLLTNNHVIAAAAGGAGSVSVTLADGRVTAGTIVGRDPSDDLAVVKIGLSGLTAATFSPSSALQVGQTVVAVGAPLGLSDTVTAGIVSTIARPVQTGDSSSDTAVFNAVQTDAAINPGNSGGPLVNLNGDVVGINAAIASDQSSGGLQVPGQAQSQAGNIGIGFAIPSDEASRIAGELIATGKATHAIIGVSVQQSATQSVAGATVKSITAGGPAARAGIRAGDVVIQVDAQRIDGPDALIAAIRSYAPAQKVTIKYRRGGHIAVVSVTLGSAAS
jgi:putative serine protease PepD